MSENTKTDIEENGAEDSEDPGHSGAEEAQDEETQEDASASLEDLKKEEDGLLRELAKVDNYRKELAEEKQNSLDHEKRKMEKLLPVLDNFKKAIKRFGEPISDRQKDILEGIENMHKQVLTVLQEFGVAETEDPGERVALDSSHHEAE